MSTSMKQTFSILPLLVMIMGVVICIPANADNEYTPTSHEKVIYQAPLVGIGTEGKEVTITHFGIAAAFVGQKHMHPGPTYVYVLEGELTVEVEGETKTFKMGEVYAMGADQAVTGMNLNPVADLEIVVFQIKDTGKPARISVE